MTLSLLETARLIGGRCEYNKENEPIYVLKGVSSLIPSGYDLPNYMTLRRPAPEVKRFTDSDPGTSTSLDYHNAGEMDPETVRRFSRKVVRQTNEAMVLILVDTGKYFDLNVLTHINKRCKTALVPQYAYGPSPRHGPTPVVAQIVQGLVDKVQVEGETDFRPPSYREHLYVTIIPVMALNFREEICPELKEQYIDLERLRKIYDDFDDDDSQTWDKHFRLFNNLDGSAVWDCHRFVKGMGMIFIELGDGKPHTITHWNGDSVTTQKKDRMIPIALVVPGDVDNKKWIHPTLLAEHPLKNCFSHTSYGSVY